MLKKDIRVQKNELRDKMKRFRREMLPLVKQKKDMAIRRGVQSLKQYQACQTLLTFVSTDIEVDTRGLIGQALRDGKRVAVPYCVDGTRQMDFYYIQSMKDIINTGQCQQRGNRHHCHRPQEHGGKCLFIVKLIPQNRIACYG